MVEFTCSRCGKCCQNLGRYITIERQLDKGYFYCHCSLNGEYFFARVTGEEEYIQRESNPERGSCPFLHQEGEGRYLCLIYPSRSRICREFRCSSLDIFDARGSRQGRVGGRRSLLSRDPELLALWEKEIRTLQNENDHHWHKAVKILLEDKGYRVVIYE